MANNFGKHGLYAKHSFNLENVTFSMWTKEEIKKLCVVKITTPLTFDQLGHPLPGGLYDGALGPIKDVELCKTCNKNTSLCPGHFGYIDLPLPTVNPLFHKTISIIFKMSCLVCNRMQVNDEQKRLFAVQIHLLNCGMVTEARRIESLMIEMSEQKNLVDIEEKIEKIEIMAQSIKGSADNKILNKTTETLRNKYLSMLLKPASIRKRCLHCLKLRNKIQTFRNRIYITQKDDKKDETVNETIEETIQLEDTLNMDRTAKELPTEEELAVMLKKYQLKLMTPTEIKDYLRALWLNDKQIIMELIPVLKHINIEHPTDTMLLEMIPVLPPSSRPVNMMNRALIEHPQTKNYKTILQDVLVMKPVIHIVQGNSVDTLPLESRSVYNTLGGTTAAEKLNFLWETLQSDVDSLMDKDMSAKRSDVQGLKQIIEKKEGVIRMHMMGKRVNFAARSVVTPDPNLNIDEIGIPEEFAKKLTYPVPVTAWNVTELRKMVMNGPLVHPGAVMVEFENGTIFRINSKNKTQQESLLKRLLTPGDSDVHSTGVKIVHRHLCNGDILLLNRQPTLHKPSIMAHTARILKGEKTIRLHYANCKAYNADFDGDEMNAHFPQNELARSEGYTLANVCNQYVVPKDGTPLSGLIQDHMVSGVRLCMRGKFFSRMDYHQLVYQALSYKKGKIKFLPPAIIKPMVLWSGKQILSTVIINVVPKNKVYLNLTDTAKISANNWINEEPREWLAGGTPFTDRNEMSEAEVIIRNGELLCGVLDKKHYGATPYGLVHCIYELYGGEYATKLLSSLAKLFMCFLQQEGFTLGVHDILVLSKADKERLEIIQEARTIGNYAAASALDIPPETADVDLSKRLEQASANNPKFRTIIDRQYKQMLDQYTNGINKACLPAGLLCKFPHNNLQLMVQSGAKGSTVNTMQISCLLGQIELEGRRPPLMISGKSLPSFVPHDTTPRAGGFIDGRFMTGIQPQEFFFHCMAGREGLIDTAVKTSRSGYLQRCLVKHLEGLKVCYDMTVRDSDHSVIQFFYGEDGMDISKVQFLNRQQLRFLAENCKVIVNSNTIDSLKQIENYSKLEKHVKHLKRWTSKHGDPLQKRRVSPFLLFSQALKDKINIESSNKIKKRTGRTVLTKNLCDMWYRSSPEEIHRYYKDARPCPNPTNLDFQPDYYYGSLNDKIIKLLDNYTKNEPNKEFEDMLKLKAIQSLAAPGEAVGLLAAQSIGEPSTQMTLNTFHFAGRGEMNVTLGIPRLREILMMASKNIKTPSMEVPFLAVPNVEVHGERLRKSLTRVTVANVLERVDVTVVSQNQGTVRENLYTLRFVVLPKELYEIEYNVTPKMILKHVTRSYFSQLFTAVKKMVKGSVSGSLVDEKLDKNKKISVNEKDDDFDEDKTEETSDRPNEDSSSDEEPEGGEEDAKLTNKYTARHEDQDPSDSEADNSDSDVENSINMDKSDDDSDAFDMKSKKSKDKFDVVKAYSYAREFSYDKDNNRWIQITFSLPIIYKNIDLTTAIKGSAEKSVIWQTENIKRAITYMKDDKVLTMRTDGINITEMFKHNDLLDLNKLYSNDIHQMALTYGIEAARRVIVKEVQDVFKVYGITVDPRHLLLIADYMTYNGSFEPLSRKGMECNPSPLQQMSFESSLTFLKTASIQGKQDNLSSPSSCLMLGKPCTTGTGSFQLLQKIGRAN